MGKSIEPVLVGCGWFQIGRFNGRGLGPGR